MILSLNPNGDAFMVWSWANVPAWIKNNSSLTTNFEVKWVAVIDTDKHKNWAEIPLFLEGSNFGQHIIKQRVDNQMIIFGGMKRRGRDNDPDPKDTNRLNAAAELSFAEADAMAEAA